MTVFDKHEAWEMKPRGLTIEETEKPELVINQLFDYATLPQLRWQMWEAAKTLVAGDFHQLTSRDRSTLISFYEQLQRLVEAAHLMQQRSRLKNNA